MEQQLQLPSIFVFICCLLFLLDWMKKGFTKYKGRNPKPLPGPWNLPFIGSMHHMVGQLPFRALRELTRKHGPLMLVRIGQVDYAVASSREAAEEILKKQDITFASRPQLVAAQVIVYGATDIGWTPYGPYWKQLRRICFMELLGTKRIRSFSSIRTEETLDLMRDISRSETEHIDLSEKLFGLANAIVCRAAFGKRWDRRERFVTIIKETFDLLGGLCLADTFPSLNFLDILTGSMSKMQRVRRQMDDILGEVIKEHEVKAATSNSERVDEVDLVDVLLRLKDDPKLEIPTTTDNVKAVILDMFIAGTETSSTVVEWAMSELIRNPSIMERAQEEVREAMKGKNRVEDSDTSELKYMKLIIKETMRLHPPAPLLQRRCRETCEVMGYEIEAGTCVFVNAWAIGRDPRHWDDAETFKPERFQGSSIGFNGLDLEYLPFGAGRRICPGIGFGLAVVELALASLLLHFDWKLPDGMKPEELDMRETRGLVASRKTELKLMATTRIPLPATI
ncbi:unnamed protein product [Musa acuminata subsp. burmannicoides]